MPEYIVFMHNDLVADEQNDWDAYLDHLKQSGIFEGGSEIGRGICVRKNGSAPPITEHLVGYLRVRANSIEDVKSVLTGNPHFEAGGTVEIRELPRS
jgi:hypothetical protein